MYSFRGDPRACFLSFVQAEFCSICAALVAFTAAFNTAWPLLYPYETFGLDFTHIALPNMLLLLLLLPIVLIAYNASKKR